MKQKKSRDTILRVYAVLVVFVSFPTSDKDDTHKGAKDKANAETKAQATKGFQHFSFSSFVEMHA